VSIPDIEATSTLEHVLSVAVPLSRRTREQSRVIARVLDTTLARLETEFAGRFIQGVLSVARSKVPSFSPTGATFGTVGAANSGPLLATGYLPDIPFAPARWPESKSPPSYKVRIPRTFASTHAMVEMRALYHCGKHIRNSLQSRSKMETWSTTVLHLRRWRK